MFKKNERLSRSEFQEYFKKGSRQHGEFTTILTFRSPSRKVAVVVGKKVAKSAVQRNLIKRRIFGVLKQRCNEVLPVQGGLIIITKPTITSLSRKAMETYIESEVARVYKSA